MPTLEPRLGIRAIRPLVSGLRAMGHDPSALLSAAGIDAGPLADPDARVPMSAGVRLLEGAAAALGDDAVGLHLAERADPASFDVTFYAMTSSATLGEGFERVARFQRLIHDTSRVALDVADGRAFLRHALPGGHAAPRSSAEFILAAWVRIGRMAVGRDWSPMEIRFAHDEPASTSEHERLFRGPLRFRAGENALVLDASLLDAPCVGANPGLLAVLESHAVDRLRRLPETPALADRVRELLADDLAGGGPSAARVAARLKMSLRTLDRGLAAEGTSFRRLLEQLRHEWAAQALADSRLAIGEVAFLLGFGDLSAFHRAFKRWTGETPVQYRRRLASLA